MSRGVPAWYRYTAFAVFLAVLGVVSYGAREALKTNTNDILDWLPVHFEETQSLFEFARCFGSEEILMISWPDCRLDDERLPRLADELRKPVPANAGQPYFQTVTTGAEALDRLTSPPLELTLAEASRRLTGLLIGPDGRTTSLVMTINEAGKIDRHAAIAYVFQAADRVPGLSRDSIHVAGTMIDGVAIDEASQGSLQTLTFCSFGACILLMYAVFRCWTTTVLIFAVALFNQQLTMAAIYFTGWHMDSVLLMAPSLIFVVSVSGGVHLTNYYRQAVRSHGLTEAPLQSVRHGWVPCLLSAGTTSLGIVSLVASSLMPIQKFGTYASTMVLAGTLVVFLMLPAFFTQWPSRSWARRVGQEPLGDQGLDALWSRLAAAVTGAHGPILVVAIGIVVAAGWGVTKTRCTAQIHDMFSPEARVVRDYDWLETNVGSLVPIEVVIRLPPPPADSESYETPLLDRLQVLKKAEEAMRQAEGIDTVISPLTFAPPLPAGRATGLAALQRGRVKALDRRLTESLAEFVNLEFLCPLTADGSVGSLDEAAAGGQHAWRLSGRVAASKGWDYRRVLADVQRRVTAAMQTTAGDFPTASARFSGGLPVVQRAQEQMLSDLINSFTSAFVVIAAALVVMMLGWSARDWWGASSGRQVTCALGSALGAGLCAMLPNVLPCVAVFGTLGLLGIKIEVGTVMTASVAMGIAVDDTVHYINWFRRGMAAGLTQREAVQWAYQRCGTAMSQTSMIVGFGLLVYALSDFGPIQRFAWMMFSTLMVALLADLTVTPALLASPLGRLFMPARGLPEPVPADDAGYLRGRRLLEALNKQEIDYPPFG